MDLLCNSTDWFLYDGNVYTHEKKIKKYVWNQAFSQDSLQSNTDVNTYFKGNNV